MAKREAPNAWTRVRAPDASPDRSALQPDVRSINPSRDGSMVTITAPQNFTIHSHFSGPCEIASMPKTRKMPHFCGQKTRFSTNCVELSTDMRRSNSWPTYLHYGYLVVLNGMLACPLLAISRHPEGHTRESALPPKANIRWRKNASDSKSGPAF